MPRDTQIFSGADHAGNSDYTLPGNSEIEVLAVNANFKDNGAGADWCPAVVMFSDSGHVIARAMLPDVKVTAGGDAEVSFFPGVKPGSAGGVTGIVSGTYQGHLASSTLPSGAATTLTWDATVSAPGSFPIISNTPFGVTTFHVTSWRVHVDFIVNFPAGSYDRYIEVNQTPSTGNLDLATPARVRSQVTPDGDTLAVSCVVGGNPFSASNLNLVAYQGSGVSKAISAYCWLVGWPLPLPSEVWS